MELHVKMMEIEERSDQNRDSIPSVSCWNIPNNVYKNTWMEQITFSDKTAKYSRQVFV